MFNRAFYGYTLYGLFSVYLNIHVSCKTDLLTYWITWLYLFHIHGIDNYRISGCESFFILDVTLPKLALSRESITVVLPASGCDGWLERAVWFLLQKAMWWWQKRLFSLSILWNVSGFLLILVSWWMEWVLFYKAHLYLIFSSISNVIWNTLLLDHFIP